MAVIVLLLGTFQIQTYLMNVNAPRYLFFYYGGKTANTYFPLGSGFATFGSDQAARNYSRLYYQYGFNSLFGMNTKDGSFLSDTFWPMAIGQFGWIGSILYILIYVRIFFSFKWMNLNSEQKALLYAGYMQYIIHVSCVSCCTYCNILQRSWGGKNVINMLLLYFLGSYIRKYSLGERFDKKSLLKILIATTALNVSLNSLISIATGGKPHIPFARDCSIFIAIEAVALMMFFMKVEFHSNFINRVAKHVFAVYLFEGAFRQIMQIVVFDYSIYEGEWYWPLVNIAVALIAMVGCMSIDVLAQWMLKPFRKAALKMLGDIINISQKIFIYCQRVTLTKSISSDNESD